MAISRWDEVFKDTLRQVLEQGTHVVAGTSQSVGSGKEFVEVLNHQFILKDPRDRILWNPARGFNLYGALARFFWMLSGSDRVKDIAFYEPKVLGFSDDALSIPGSNYGTRLFMPEPGLDQIKAIIERIQDEPGTRRAAAAIYRPEDASRKSRDIPCAFGLAFHPRDDRLHMTMIMRSNAAWGLLPYNVFEFTLLGELVAALSGVALGEYTHIALSMHLYKATNASPGELALATKALDQDLGMVPSSMLPMPRMTYEELRRVVEWTADLRYDAKAMNVTNFRDYISRCRDKCDRYWVQLCLPLLAYALFNQKKINAGMTVLGEVEEPLRRKLLDHPILQGLDIPGLEENPLLLTSRLNLLQYSADKSISEGRREMLWQTYYRQYQEDFSSAEMAERRRQSPETAREWEVRDRAAEQPELFEQ